MPDLKETSLKIWEWLELYDLRTGALYNCDELSANFLESTGVPPCWPVHLASEVATWPGIQLMEPTDPDKFVCLADEIASAPAERYNPAMRSQYAGGTSRYCRLRQAMVLLRATNV
jgi:hypothetical protein